MTTVLDQLRIPGRAIRDAERLIAAVDQGDPATIRALLSLTPPDHLRAITLALALRLMPRRMPAEPSDVVIENGVFVRPCGTHAAYDRHRNRGEQPCPACVEAERAYQREKKRRKRRDPIGSPRFVA